MAGDKDNGASDSDRLVLDVVKDLHGRGELVYGWPIAKRIHERTGSWRGAGHGRINGSLDRLVRDGWLCRTMEQTKPGMDRPPRIYYEPTQRESGDKTADLSPGRPFDKASSVRVAFSANT